MIAKDFTKPCVPRKQGFGRETIALKQAKLYPTHQATDTHMTATLQSSQSATGVLPYAIKIHRHQKS